MSALAFASGDVPKANQVQAGPTAEPLGMDIVATWKALSIILTGAFGVLALTTDYRDKQGRITTWGRVALIGILLSTAGGVTAQVKESTDDAQRALSLATQTNTAVSGIERLLSPIGTPNFAFSIWAPCIAKRQSNCVVTKNNRVIGLFRARIDFFFKNDVPEDADAYSPDLAFEVETRHSDSLLAGYLNLDFNGREPLYNNGKFRSILDFAGSTMVLMFENDLAKYMESGIFEFKGVALTLGDGRREVIGSNQMSKVDGQIGRYYAYKFSRPLGSFSFFGE